MNRLSTPDVEENQDKKPSLQERINIQVFFFFLTQTLRLLLCSLLVCLANLAKLLRWIFQFIESGEKERLMELLRERLIECGWKDEMKALCRYNSFFLFFSLGLYYFHTLIS